MSTKTWYGGNGDWTNSADWIGGEPGGGDAAIINSGIVELDSSDPGIAVQSINIASTAATLTIEDAGQTQTVTGDLINSGYLGVDPTGSGGSALVVGGALTNNGVILLDGASGSGASALTIAGALINNGSLTIGPSDGSLSNSATVTASSVNNLATAGLPVGTITLNGNANATGATDQATLEIEGPAGFGAVGTVTGGVTLSGNSEVEFASGQITTIGVGGSLSLVGPNAFVADSGDTGANSALALTDVYGDLGLFDGASLTTGNLNIHGNTTFVNGMLSGSTGVGIDNGANNGGSSLNINGTLTIEDPDNTSVDLWVGGGLNNTGPTTVTADAIDMSSGSVWVFSFGGSAATTTLDIAGPAGFGTTGVLTGEVSVAADGANALFEFGSGQIAAIDGALVISGATAFFADSGATGYNSALTDLANVAGDLSLEDGAAVQTSGNLTVSGYVELDSEGGDPGGGNLNVDGLLTFTSGAALYMGLGYFSPMTASPKVTAEALDNAGLLEIGGVPSGAPSMVIVNGPMQNTGAILLFTAGPSNADSGSGTSPSAGIITVTGANSFSQTAGSTADDGLLSAQTVDIAGGTLTGLGTIDGALQIAGGSVEALGYGLANGGAEFTPPVPGALTVNGSYNQTAGDLTADLYTPSGGAPTSSELAVTGDVNLQGGALQASLDASLPGLAAGESFVVLTETAGEIAGLFVNLQEGAAAGDGAYVDLGGGLTLGADYNDAAGNITLEVVATPASTADAWTGGSDFWSNAADWSHGVPTFYSDVTIGAPSASVTLGADATINSLAIDAGDALSTDGGATLTIGAAAAIAAAASLDLGGNLFAGGALTNDGLVDGAGIVGTWTIENAADGVIDADVAGGTLTLEADIFATATPSFTNDGALRAENGGTLDIIDATAGNFTDLTGGVLSGGLYDVVDPIGAGASTIEITGAGATPIAQLAPGTTVVLSGATSTLVAGGETLAESLTFIGYDQGTGTSAALNLYFGDNSQSAQAFAAQQQVELAGVVSLNGGTFSSPGLTIDTTGTVFGSGWFDGATEINAALDGPVANNGSIIAGGLAQDHVSPTLVVNGPVTGAGELWVTGDSTLELGGTVSASETALLNNSETSGNRETLQIDATSVNPGSATGFAAAIGATVAGVVDGLQVGDVIDLKNLAGAAGWSFDGTTLAVHFASGPDADLNLAGSDLSASTDFALSVDASGTGADIVIAPPPPVIQTPTNGSTIANADPAISGTGENGDIVTVKIDGAVAGTALVSAGAWSFTPASPLSNATHSVTATEANAAGTASAVSNTDSFTIDTATPPAPVIQAPANGSTIANADPAITGTGENGDVVTVKIDGAVAGTALVSAGAWSFTSASPLSNATHSVTATEANAAGTVSAVSNTDSFTVNAGGGVAVTINPVDGDNVINNAEAHASGGVLVSGTVSGLATGATFAVTLTDGSLSKVYVATVGAGGVWSASIPSADAVTLANGTATVAATITATVKASEQVIVAETLPTVTINKINGDDIIDNRAGDGSNNGCGGGQKGGGVAVQLSGSVTGIAPGSAFSVDIVDGAFSKSYTATVNTAGTGWTAAVPASDVAQLPGGTAKVTAEVTDRYGNVSLPAVQSVVVETTPTVLSASASPASGDLDAGKIVTITLAMSEAVKVTGTPTLSLNDCGVATYDSAHSTATSLAFDYVVAAGQNTSDLAVTGVELGRGASIEDSAGDAADLSGAVARLGLIIDTAPPTVRKVVASPGSGEVATGQTVTVTLDMSEAVTVAGTPTLLLNDGGAAVYDKAHSSSTALVFDYAVAAGQKTSDLQLVGVELSANASVEDLAGNIANFSGADADLRLGVNAKPSGTQGGGAGGCAVGGKEEVELLSACSTPVTFAAGAAGGLKLDASAGFTGQIAGFGAGDALDLSDIAFNAHTRLSYSSNSAHTGGTLTVSDGAHTANLDLLGQYAAAGFQSAGDQAGGAIVTYAGSTGNSGESWFLASPKA